MTRFYEYHGHVVSLLVFEPFERHGGAEGGGDLFTLDGFGCLKGDERRTLRCRMEDAGCRTRTVVCIRHPASLHQGCVVQQPASFPRRQQRRSVAVHYNPAQRSSKWRGLLDDAIGHTYDHVLQRAVGALQ